MRHGRVAGPKHLLLDEAYLSSFGHLRLPQHFYTALQRFDAWFEPALLAEWAQAYEGVLGERFRLEAQASLPLVGGSAGVEEVYAGVRGCGGAGAEVEA